MPALALALALTLALILASALALSASWYCNGQRWGFFSWSLAKNPKIFNLLVSRLLRGLQENSQPGGVV